MPAQSQEPVNASEHFLVGARTIVLPFWNISRDTNINWIGDGIAEVLATELGKIADVEVFSRSAIANSLIGLGLPNADALSRADALAVGLHAGARWLIAGEYERVGTQISITTKIVDGQTGKVIRRARIDGPFAELFALQDQIIDALGPLAALDARIVAPAPQMVNAARFDGPPAPVPPAVASARDAQGRLTVRAVRLAAPLTLDGRLDEEIYQTVPSFGDFIQQEPNEGQPATERTEAWIFFDDENVYVSARLWSTQPERLTANEMRRDHMNIFRNDYFSVTLDTLFDHRSGVFVMTNALGGLRDALITDESRSTNFDYNMVWDVKSQRFDGGWATEFAVPFKSLRYLQGREQVWGLILARTDYWKNEWSYLTPIPSSAGPSGSFRIASGAVLVGIEAPPSDLNLDVKSYISGESHTVPNSSGFATAQGQDVGVDLKYGLTKSLAVDFTYNTDFAQVEVDDQQVNLTRFSLFYPEKREFFLEGQGLFTFGGATANGRGATPILFFSRQIGLNNGVAVPILGGARLMGKAGSFNVGVLSIRTEAVDAMGLPATTFSVLRVKKDILRRGGIGLIATTRSPSYSGPGTSVVAGVDMSLAFSNTFETVSYYARSRTYGATGDEESYRGRLYYNGNTYALDVDYLKVGDAFNPEVGFQTRRGYRRSFLMARFSPRPRIRGIRRLWLDATAERLEGTTGGELQTQNIGGTFRVDFRSGDVMTAKIDRVDDRPDATFRLGGGVVVLPGAYQFDQGTLSYQIAPQRPLTGTFSATVGDFYGGTQNAFSYTGRVDLTQHLAIEPRVSVNWLDLPQGKVRTELYSARTTVTMTPRMFVATFLQYNSAANVVGVNTRFRWEYRPGSDFFFVYSEGRDTLVSGFPGLTNRQLVAKFTRLFRF